MKARDRTTRDYQVELDAEAIRRARLVRAASAGGIVLALLVIWWMSSPEEAPTEVPPPAVVMPPEEEQAAVVPGEREVARVELPALAPQSVAEGAAEMDAGSVEEGAGGEPESLPGDQAGSGERVDAAQTETPAPSADEASLPQASADGRFRVEMPDFVALDEVRQAARMAEELGAPTSVLRRVVVGPFERRADAEAASRRAQSAHGLNALIIGSEARGWRVQLGVFGAADNAVALRDTLVADDFRTSMDARLLVGPYATHDAAETVRSALEQGAGIRGMRVLEMQ